MQPVVTALAAQTGFVEVNYRRGFEAGADLGEEFGEITCGSAGDGGDGARPVVVFPHRQRRLMIWCSVTCTLIGGMSKTCRREQSTSSARARSDPQPRQHEGSWRITTSGSDTCSRVCPRCPCWPPGFRFEGLRKDRGAGALGPSDEGGFDEFCEFVRNCASRSATRSFSAEFSARRESSSTRMPTISSTNSVDVGCVIPQLSHHRQFIVQQHAQQYLSISFESLKPHCIRHFK